MRRRLDRAVEWADPLVVLIHHPPAYPHDRPIPLLPLLECIVLLLFLHEEDTFVEGVLAVQVLLPSITDRVVPFLGYSSPNGSLRQYPICKLSTKDEKDSECERPLDLEFPS